MTIGAYILVQNPISNGYPFLEVINNCLDFCDEILIVDGGTTDGSFDKLPKDDRIKIKQRLWPDNSSWDFLTQQYDFGLQNLTTDWRLKMDSDYLFHENDLNDVRNYLIGSTAKIVNFEKDCFNLIDRYRAKTKVGIAVNKRMYPGIHWNTDDKYQDGDHVIEEDEWITSGIKLYVYDTCFKTRENIGKVMHKWAIAVQGKYGMDWGYKSEEDALNFMVNTARTRVDGYNQNIIPLEAHPKYIQEKIKNMTDDMLGYSLFGHQKASYFENN